MEFEWDSRKNTSNKSKHFIDFPTAIKIFDDPDRLEEDSTKPEYNEDRVKIIGQIKGIPITLVIIYTHRKKRIRIISARRANKKESKKYKDSIKTKT